MSMDLIEIYHELTNSINEIDEKLDSRTDGKAAGKRSVINKAVEASEGSWKSIVENFVEKLSSADEETLIGVYFGLTRGLSSALQDKANAIVDGIVATQPVTVPLITEEQIKPLQEVRSSLYQKVKALITLAEQFDQNEGMEMPKKRTGSNAKRGQRAITFFTWFVGEKEYAKLADVVADYDQYDKVATLTAAMRESGLNLKEPGDRIEFTLPTGDILVGVGPEDSDDPEDDPEDSTEGSDD